MVCTLRHVLHLVTRFAQTRNSVRTYVPSMVHKYIVLRRGYVTVECGPVEDRPTDRLLGCVCEESAGPTDRQGGEYGTRVAD